MILLRDYVFTISQIMKNISTEYIQEKFRGNIMLSMKIVGPVCNY